MKAVECLPGAGACPGPGFHLGGGALSLRREGLYPSPGAVGICGWSHVAGTLAALPHETQRGPQNMAVCSYHFQPKRKRLWQKFQTKL